MRGTVLFVILALMLAAAIGVLSFHTDRIIALKRPPASLGQWYKPANKRQVWLHTMFKLRREMLALEIYAQDKDPERLSKWSAKFGGDYRKIAEMVPEWEDRLNRDALAALESAAAEHRFEDIADALGELSQTCKSCHEDFRAVTATLYRAPDFSGVKVQGVPSYNDHMKGLTQQVNRIKIGFVDNQDEAALTAYEELADGMKRLGNTCATCHKKLAQPYPNPAQTEALAKLKDSLEKGQLKDKGRALGTLAVLACARCHATHRQSFDVRNLFGEKKSLGEWLDHSK